MAMARQLLRRSSGCRRLLLSLSQNRVSEGAASSTHHPLRAMATKAAASQTDGELLRILKDEIEHERQTRILAKEELQQVPKPFTIINKPGTQQVVLHRAYINEDITVTCTFQTQQLEGESSNDELEDDPDELVEMVVKVSKKGDGPYLEIHCVTYGSTPVIDRVAYKDDVTCIKDLAYDGPQFSDLDDNVQKGFVKYLTDRGIDAELSTFLLTYMKNKEQSEYTRWLNNVEAFIKK